MCILELPPHKGHHLALLSRQIASFAVLLQLLAPHLSQLTLLARCPSFLAAPMTADAVGDVGRIGPTALVAHCRLRAHFTTHDGKSPQRLFPFPDSRPRNLVTSARIICVGRWLAALDAQRLRAHFANHDGKARLCQQWTQSHPTAVLFVFFSCRRPRQGKEKAKRLGTGKKKNEFFFLILSLALALTVHNKQPFVLRYRCLVSEPGRRPLSLDPLQSGCYTVSTDDDRSVQSWLDQIFCRLGFRITTLQPQIHFSSCSSRHFSPEGRKEFV